MRPSRTEVDEAKQWGGPSCAFVIDALEADNERLRALVKEAETADGYQSYHRVTCPWCQAQRADGIMEPHSTDCPAFTPDGAVR